MENWSATGILPREPDPDCSPGHDDPQRMVSNGLVAMGTMLAIGACFASCFGVALQKSVHNDNQLRTKEQRRPVWRIPRWWCGIMSMILGSLMDMAALPFVPLSRIAALGAVSMFANIVIQPAFLGEQVTANDRIGCVLSVLGTSAACYFGAAGEHNVPSKCILMYFADPLFDAYFCFILVVLAVLLGLMEGFRRRENALRAAGLIDGVLECVGAWERLDEFAQKVPSRERLFPFITRFGPQFYPAVHAIFAGTVGAWSIMFAKAVLKFLGNAIYADTRPQRMRSWWYVGGFLVPTAFCLWCQIRYLNVALSIYRDALFTYPVYQMFWVGAGIICGLVFYQEYRDIKNLNALLFIVGCVINLVGLIVLAGRQSVTPAPETPQAAGEVLGPPARPLAAAGFAAEAGCDDDRVPPGRWKDDQKVELIPQEGGASSREVTPCLSPEATADGQVTPPRRRKGLSPNINPGAARKGFP